MALTGPRGTPSVEKFCRQCDMVTSHYVVRATGKAAHCRACATTRNRRYYARKLAEDGNASRRRWRRHRLKSVYSLTEADFAAILSQQGGGCAVCHSAGSLKNHLCIDHNHETGQVRGILCNRCNVGLGWFRDSQHLLRAAKDYICEELHGLR